MFRGSLAVLAVVFGASLAQAASPFDGRYSGQATWAGNGNYRCTASTDVTINVRDGAFNFGPADSRTTVVVGPDGSFTGQSGMRHVQGRISGNEMTATVNADRCNYQWALRK